MKPPMTAGYFRAWLLAKPPDEIVGEAVSATENPVSRAYRHAGYEAEIFHLYHRVSDGGVWSQHGVSDSAGWREYANEPWLVDFNRRLDLSSHARVTARWALDALAHAEQTGQDVNEEDAGRHQRDAVGNNGDDDGNGKGDSTAPGDDSRSGNGAA